MWQGVAVFVLTMVASVFWALYFRYSGEGKAHRAALADLGIIAVGAFNVVSYTENHWMLVPIMAGTYVGTVVAVKRRKVETRG
jgi:hypothetical protein